MGNDSDKPQIPDDDTVPEARRRREPPTIELSASEVAAETAAADPPPAGPTEADATTAAPRRSPRGSGLLGAALTGAAGAAAVLAAAWLGGWSMTAEPPVSSVADASAVAALAARMSALEADFRTAAALPQATGTDSAGLGPRLTALEQAVATMGDELAAAEAATGKLDTSVGTLQSELAALKTTPREGAPMPDLAPIESRIAEVATIAESARAAAAKAEARMDAEAGADRRGAGTDQPLRRAVTAMQLEAAVRQGEPYARLLVAAKSFAADAAPLAPLESFAAGGVPRAAVLGAELQALLPALAKRRETPASDEAGLLDRLQASATRLVRIRRENPAEGDSHEAVASRAVAAAQRGDLAAARQELTTLPAAQRAALSGWLARADAREAALAAARAYAADAVAALAQPAP